MHPTRKREEKKENAKFFARLHHEGRKISVREGVSKARLGKALRGDGDRIVSTRIRKKKGPPKKKPCSGVAGARWDGWRSGKSPRPKALSDNKKKGDSMPSREGEGKGVEVCIGAKKIMVPSSPHLLRRTRERG